jgi:hypothetical protein
MPMNIKLPIAPSPAVHRKIIGFNLLDIAFPGMIFLLGFFFGNANAIKPLSHCVEFFRPIPKFSNEQKIWIAKAYPAVFIKNGSRIYDYYLASISRDSVGYILGFSSLSHLQSYKCTAKNGPTVLVSDGIVAFRVIEIGDSLDVKELHEHQ